MTIFSEIHRWWKEQRARENLPRTLRWFFRTLWEFARESTPEQRRRRYGDMDFDWERRVDTTGSTVGWRERLVGMFHSSYQPTEPAEFREMMAALKIPFEQFSFVDIGSGKGRVLLMAADYPFRRVLGVELLPELHRIAQENIRQYHRESQRCFAIESVCGDARDFAFPDEPAVLYLFNPLPEPGMVRFMENLESSLQKRARPLYVVYQNPVWEDLLARVGGMKKIAGTHQYVVYSNVA